MLSCQATSNGAAFIVSAPGAQPIGTKPLSKRLLRRRARKYCWDQVSIERGSSSSTGLEAWWSAAEVAGKCLDHTPEVAAWTRHGAQVGGRGVVCPGVDGGGWGGGRSCGRGKAAEEKNVVRAQEEGLVHWPDSVPTRRALHARTVNVSAHASKQRGGGFTRFAFPPPTPPPHTRCKLALFKSTRRTRTSPDVTVMIRESSSTCNCHIILASLPLLQRKKIQHELLISIRGKTHDETLRPVQK